MYLHSDSDEFEIVIILSLQSCYDKILVSFYYLQRKTNYANSTWKSITQHKLGRMFRVKYVSEQRNILEDYYLTYFGIRFYLNYVC